MYHIHKFYQYKLKTLEIKNLILYFFLLVFKISLNLNLDIYYKWAGFSKTLLKKVFQLVSNKKNNINAFYLNFLLLLIKVNSIIKKKNYKKYALIIYSTSRFNLIFVILIKVIAFFT